MGLIEVGNKSRVVISRIEGNHHMRRKLMDMGVIPGIPVTIVRKDHNGPMLLSVMGRKIMVGQSLAQNVFVRSA